MPVDNIETTEAIDPKKVYSLSYLVKKGMFGSVKQFSTARQHVFEDLMSASPVLKASIQGEGSHRTYEIEGKRLLDYLKKRS